MPQTGGCKPVIGLSPGYGDCPPHPRHSPSPPCPRCPHSRRLLCFAADCNKGVWMTPGQCPEMSSADLLQFPHCLTASHLHWPGLTVSPSIHFQYTHSPSSSPLMYPLWSNAEPLTDWSTPDKGSLLLSSVQSFSPHLSCASCWIWHVCHIFVTYRHTQHELLCSVCSIL